MIGEMRFGQAGRSAVSQVPRCYRCFIQNASFSLDGRYIGGRNEQVFGSGNEARLTGQRRYRTVFLVHNLRRVINLLEANELMMATRKYVATT